MRQAYKHRNTGKKGLYKISDDDIQKLENILVATLVLWVQVKPQSTLEKSWLLRNDRDGLTHLLKIDLI